MPMGLLTPSRVYNTRNSNVGLMGGFRPQQAPRLMATPEDEAMARRYAQQQALSVPQQQPQRERVSGWRLLDRVLGGQTVTEGLDAERARLTQEAMRPQMLAQQAAILDTIQDPQERALFLTSPEEWAKNKGQQFAPQVVGAGAAQVVNGRRTVDQGTYAETGDTTVYRNSEGVAPVYTRMTPSIAEQNTAYANETGRINANNPVTVAQDALLVDPRTGRTIAQGVQRPDVVNVAPGGTAVPFDAQGRPLPAYQSPVERPLSNAEQNALDALELDVTRGAEVLGQVNQVIGAIDSGAFELNPLATTSYRARNASGNSSPQSLAYANALTTVNSLRNALLRDNKGTQTEGDALRTLDEVIAGWGDERVVRQGLERFSQQYAQIQQTRQGQLERRRSGDARRPGGGDGASNAGSVVSVSTPAQAQALPVGTRYRTPDGQEYIR